MDLRRQNHSYHSLFRGRRLLGPRAPRVLLFPLRIFPRCVEMLYDLVVGEFFRLLRFAAAAFLARRAGDGPIILRRSIPFGAAIRTGPRVVRQSVAPNLFAGLVEDLYEFLGKVRARVVTIAGHFAHSPTRPIRRVGLLGNVIPRQVFVIHFLLEFPIGADGAHLGRFVGGVVVGFNFSADSVFLDDSVLGRSHGRSHRQQPQRGKRVQETTDQSPPISWRAVAF